MGLFKKKPEPSPQIKYVETFPDRFMPQLPGQFKVVEWGCYGESPQVTVTFRMDSSDWYKFSESDTWLKCKQYLEELELIYKQTLLRGKEHLLGELSNK